MSRKLRKTVMRDVIATLSRFLAIVIITALGAFIFAGLRAAAPDMRATAENYFAEQKLMDYRLLCTFGFTNDDIAALKDLGGVTAVSAGYGADIMTNLGETRLHTVGDINKLTLVEGRLPENEHEIVVGETLVEVSAAKPGDTVTVNADNRSATLDLLRGREFTVVGVVRSPVYITKFLGTTDIGGGELKNFAYVLPSAFDSEYFTEVYALTGGEDMSSALQKFGTAREVARYQEIYDALIASGVPAEYIDLESPKWYIFDRDDNAGYAGFSGDADRIDALSLTIPVFFFLVAALVCLTTMTRMVDEQRTGIGTLKALGFLRGQIGFKFVAYAAAASLIGAAIGIVSGLFAFPEVIWGAYGILYRLPPIHIGANWITVIATVLFAVLSTLIPTWAVCVGTLTESPASLMRPRAPKPGVRVFLEYFPKIWKRMKFSQKVTARNLFLNRRRLIMTLIGVLGCTALLLMGFGLRNSITGIADRQYSSIYTQDASVVLADASDSAADSGLNRALADIGADSLYYYEISADISTDTHKKTTLETALWVPERGGDISEFLDLHGADTTNAVVTKKLAEWLNIRVGDEIIIKTNRTDGGDRTARLPVSGICENYVGHRVYISSATYERLFGEKPEYAAALVNFGETRDIERLVACENVLTVVDVSVFRENVMDMLKAMDTIIWLILVLSGTLAFVVLYNLTNINITERVRELATLKVLGFQEYEVRNYVQRENRVLTAVGILLGFVAGIFLTQYVVTTAEVDSVMFRRKIEWSSYLIAAAITWIAAELVNLATLPSMKRIDMVDSLKSAE